MPIVASDIVFRLSVAAAAGDTTGGTPATSLGDQVSTTVITPAALENIFDNVSGAEALAGDVEYRGIFVLNNHATLTLTGATASVQSQTAGGATADIALDNIAVSAKGSASPQMATIANENTSPGGSAGAFGAGPLSIGDIGPGQVKGIWIRRTVGAATGGTNLDGLVIAIGGDTLQ
jgi:hypothetical protein